MMSSCPVCERTFENSLSNEFVIHVNACLDSQEHELIPKNFYVQDEARLHPLMKKKKEREQASSCVVCGKPKATAAHIKKCGKQNGVNTSQLIRLVGNNESKDNSNLENIVLKDSNLNQSKILNDLFTENQSQSNITKELSSTDPTIQKSSNNCSEFQFLPVVHSSILNQQSSTADDPECTVVLDKTIAKSKSKKNQTKLKVVRKSKNQKDKLPENFSQDAPLNAVKCKNTVKLKRKPLVKANLDDLIVQNFKDEYTPERELPRSWKLATLSYDSEMYIVEGFENFCECFDFKTKMNGFEVGNETK